MTLHVPTLVLMLVFGFGLLTLQLGVAGRGARGFDELRRLGWGAGACFLGFLCFSLQAVLPGWLVLLAGNGLLMAGLGCFALAVYRHTLNRSLPTWHLWLFVAAALAVLAALQSGTPLRAGLMSAAMALLMLPATRVALRHGWHGERSFRVVALLLLLACAAWLARAAYAAWWARQQPVPAGDFANLSSAIFMLAFMAVLAAGFSFVLACFERMASQMRELASVDGLTGCFNHNTAVSLLVHSLERGRREGQPVSFVMLDLDHFKLVNDRHGHAVGDAVLRAVAACVRERLRGSDVLGRLGGEEFGVVLPATGEAGARHLADQVRLAVEALDLHGEGGVPLRVTLSAGVAVAEPERADTAETLMHLADKALYQAKQKGRNRVVVADDWMRNSTLQSMLK
jgi:diguanylate cyclase (GGDEF)-like protein